MPSSRARSASFIWIARVGGRVVVPAPTAAPRQRPALFIETPRCDPGNAALSPRAPLARQPFGSARAARKPLGGNGVGARTFPFAVLAASQASNPDSTAPGDEVCSRAARIARSFAYSF